jgi:hypothetical protein
MPLSLKELLIYFVLLALLLLIQCRFTSIRLHVNKVIFQLSTNTIAAAAAK